MASELSVSLMFFSVQYRVPTFWKIRECQRILFCLECQGIIGIFCLSWNCVFVCFC